MPAMLFLNVYNVDPTMNIGIGYIIYACVAEMIVFVLALIIIPLLFKEGDIKAVLTQASFRSNYALIGIPLAESLFGASGVAVAALLSAFSIPLFNVLGKRETYEGVIRPERRLHKHRLYVSLL